MDNKDLKIIFNTAIKAAKARILAKYSIEQNIQTLREDFAGYHGLRKEGELEISKVKKGLFKLAMNLVNKVVAKDSMDEKYALFDEYKKWFSGSTVNKDEVIRYVSNIEMLSEVSSQEKDVYDNAKIQGLDELRVEGLKELVKIVSTGMEEVIKKDFEDENGIIRRENESKKGVPSNIVQELADALDIKIASYVKSAAKKSA